MASDEFQPDELGYISHRDASFAVLVAVVENGGVERDCCNVDQVPEYWERYTAREDVVAVTLLRPASHGAWSLWRSFANG